MNRNLKERNGSVAHIAQFFEYEHLRDGLMRQVSRECCELAEFMLDNLRDGAELTVGLRKLLEAKDAFVRQALVQIEEYGE